MIANFVANDLHQQRPRVCYTVEPLNRFQRAKGDILFEILIINRRAGVLCGDANQRTNFNRIQIHVTVLLDVRLYLT